MCIEICLSTEKKLLPHVSRGIEKNTHENFPFRSITLNYV